MTLSLDTKLNEYYLTYKSGSIKTKKKKNQRVVLVINSKILFLSIVLKLGLDDYVLETHISGS